MIRMRWLTLCALAGVLVAGCGGPTPKVALLIPVNAQCTTCDDFIRCDAGSGNAAVYDPTFDVYWLRPKGTLAQIATIWDFLIQLVYQKKTDQRPLATYAQRPGRTQAFERTTVENQTALVDLVQHRVNLPEAWIDQVSGDWHSNDSALRGSCRVLSKAEGLELVKLFAQPGGSQP